MARRPIPTLGQSATSAPIHSAGAGRSEHHSDQIDPPGAAQRLFSVIEAGQIAQPRNTIIRDDDTVLSVPFASAIAGVADALPIGAELTQLVDSDGHLYLDPPSQDAGTSVTLEAAMAQSSRTLAAGAHLITADELEAPVMLPNGPVIAKQKVSFTTFEPAQFSIVDFAANPDAEVALSPVPISDTEIDRENLISHAVAFRLSRRDVKAKGKGRERLAAELLWPIAQGLGRAIDATLLNALKALPANAWALGKAASAGVPFSAIRGIVGTSATGAQSIEGGIFVDGIPAELTPDMAETVLGVWNRAAVIVDPNINLTVSRLDASGAVQIVCWADMQALIPDPAKFWLVA